MQQDQYIATIRSEARIYQAISVTDRLSQPLRIMIAERMIKYEQGNLNPWEWLIDLLEGDVNDVDTRSKECQNMQGEIQRK